LCSNVLVAALVEMDERPWATWGKSRKPMNQNQLAKQLADFKVYTRPIKMNDGKVLRGYVRENFEAIWNRYTPPSCSQSATVLPPNVYAGSEHFEGATREPKVAPSKAEIPNVYADRSRVAVKAPEEPLPEYECTEHGRHTFWYLGGRVPVCAMCHPDGHR
jgi:hypothetical protein